MTEIPKMDSVDDYCRAIEKLARDAGCERIMHPARDTTSNTLKGITPTADELSRKFGFDQTPSNDVSK